LIKSSSLIGTPRARNVNVDWTRLLPSAPVCPPPSQFLFGTRVGTRPTGLFICYAPCDELEQAYRFRNGFFCVAVVPGQATDFGNCSHRLVRFVHRHAINPESCTVGAPPCHPNTINSEVGMAYMPTTALYHTKIPVLVVLKGTKSSTAQPTCLSFCHPHFTGLISRVS
jgi:hypothetical protein